MKHGSLFSGIGGFDLAAEWMGWENVFHCEWNPFGQKVLKYYWPNAKSYGDITTSDFNVHRGQISVLSGGFPCQPFSVAGKRKGKEDDRFLWKEMLRAVKEVRPTWVVAENVPGIISINRGMVFSEVQSEMETEGYEVLPFLLPACSIGAIHRRERCWIIAHSNDVRLSRSINENGNRGRQRKMEKSIKELFSCKIANSYDQLPKPINTSGNDGIPGGLDETAISKKKWRTESIKAYGNAVVPQVAHEIFKTIEQYEKLTT